MNDIITHEVTKKGKELLLNAQHIKQLNKNYSRLYATPKEYDTLRYRTRINGRLKPIGVKSYFCPDESPEGIIDELKNIHKRTDYYVGCSGGKDSICLAHYIATNHPENFKGLVFIDTGVGIKKTQEWLIGYAKEMNWAITIIKSKPPMKQSHLTDQYEWFVLNYGFPGPGSHGVIMGRLKYTAFRAFIRTLPNVDHSCIISGTRKFESHRRSMTTKPMDKDGKMFFCSPFYAKTDEFVYKYLLDNGLKRTPVHDVLGMSGECMCGCYAGIGEREIIKQLDPELDDYFTMLEEKIQVEGTDLAKKHGVWGKGTTKKQKSKVSDVVEAAICGADCGAGTMRGAENI